MYLFFVPVLMSVSAWAQPKPSPVNANSAISSALARGELVALGDVHGNDQVVTALLAFLREPENWRLVDDICR